jgi:hypothetical protein
LRGVSDVASQQVFEVTDPADSYLRSGEGGLVSVADRQGERSGREEGKPDDAFTR